MANQESLIPKENPPEMSSNSLLGRSNELSGIILARRAEINRLLGLQAIDEKELMTVRTMMGR